MTLPTAVVPPQHGDYERLVEQMLEQLNMGHSFNDLFDSVYRQLHGIVPYNRIAVALLEEPGDVLRLASCRSDGEVRLKVGYTARLAGSTLAPLVATGQSRIINDLDDYLSRKPQSVSTELICREGMKSSLTLPLLANGKPIGVIFFSSREAGIYTNQHVVLLRRLAGHIAISLEKTQLISELQRKNEELATANRSKDRFLETLQQEVDKQTQQLRQSESRYRLLVEFGDVVNSSLNIRTIFEHAADQIYRLLRCDRVSLLLAGHETVRSELAVEIISERRRLTETVVQPHSGSAFNWVMQHRVPHVVRSLESSHSFPDDQKLWESGYASKVFLPLAARNQCLGVLGIASRQSEAPDHWDLELLNEACGQLAISVDNAAAYGEIDRLKGELQQQNIYLRDEIRTDKDFGNIIGDSRAMQQVRVAIEQVAKTDSTVLILGETGTGKELIARAIHDFSSRRDELLVKVNCASLAPNLIPSELFGHEAGAFTGATERRRGRFELAHRGSIFLDEISEVPIETQVLLLRVLQERTIERVGGSEPIQIDTRVIAATNRDLKLHSESGRFREDLYYRLHVFPIRVPPLRERREDIPSLLNHFIGRFSVHMNKSITRVDRRTMEMMMNYNWPGNVRELENVIERAMIISQGDTLVVDESWLFGRPSLSAEPPTMIAGRSLAEIERQIILDALSRCHGKIYGPNGAAAELKLKPTTLYGKMRKHRIKSTRQHAPEK